MSTARGRSRSSARIRQRRHDEDTHSNVSDPEPESERSETPGDDAHAGTLTPRGSTAAIEQLIANTSHQTDAFLETPACFLFDQLPWILARL